MKPDKPATCYDTFTEAMAAATGGQVTDAPADSGVAMKDTGLLARLNATGYKKSGAALQPRAEAPVITLYCSTNYRGCVIGGSSFTWTGPSCTDTLNDIDSQVAYVGDDANDWAESFQAYNNCYAKLWEHANFQGASTDWHPALPDLGVLEDEVSSFQLS